jgi:hypothetical protein
MFQCKIDRILEKAKRLNMKLEPVISTDEMSIAEKDLKIKFPEPYVLYLTKIQNGGASDSLHEKGPYYGIYSLRESLDKNNEWEVDIRESYELADDLEICENEELTEKYQNTGTLNGTIPICAYGCGVEFRLVVNGRNPGEIWADCGTLEGDGYYSLNVDILTFYENWLDRQIMKSKDPSKGLINAYYPFLEFGNNRKYQVVGGTID